MNVIDHLEETAWTRPDHYAGFSPDGDYCIMSQHRDSDCVSRSNWICACKELSAEAWDSGDDGFDERPAVYHWRASHWAVGWCEYLMVRADALDNIKEKAGEMICALSDYPILNDDHHSELEMEEANETWANCYDDAERLKYIRDNRSQFDFHNMEDLIGCVRGKYFAGYASELLY